MSRRTLVAIVAAAAIALTALTGGLAAATGASSAHVRSVANAPTGGGVSFSGISPRRMCC